MVLSAGKYTRILLVFLAIISVEAVAQSSFTRNGMNGTLFNLQTTLDQAGLVEDFGGRIGYSIGGVLDIGADFAVSMSEIESREVTETSIGICYGIMLAKQENRVPFSIELGGVYAYSFISSGYYDDQDLQKEGEGYNLTLRLLRDFSLGDSWKIRLGIFGTYGSYNYTIVDISPATEETREFSPERETFYRYGGTVVFALKTSRARTWYVGAEPVLDEELYFSIAVQTGIVVEL